MKYNIPFSQTGLYYDLLYARKNYFFEAGCIVNLAKIYGQKGKDVLDLGCGTGQHAMELARLNYKVTGVDKSHQMLSIAKANSIQNSLPIKFIHRDIKNFLSLKPFSIVVSLFHVLSYQNTNSEVMDFFTSFSRNLKNNGIGVFDCWYGPGVFSQKPKRRVRSYFSKNTTLTRTTTPKWDKDLNLVEIMHELVINNSPKTIREKHCMRYFFLPEINHYLSLTGLRLLEWGNVGPRLVYPNPSSWDCWFVVNKK